MVWAFVIIVGLGGGIVDRDEMWFPTLAVCEAAREGAELVGAHTTDCRRREPGVYEVRSLGDFGTTGTSSQDNSDWGEALRVTIVTVPVEKGVSE